MVIKSTNPVTVVISNFNGQDVISETVSSIKNQSYPVSEILFMDDCSTDRSIEIVRERFPDVKIYRMEENTKKPNKLRNIGILEAKTKLLFLADNDILFDRECLSILIETILSSDHIAVCTPLLMYYDERDRINIGSSDLHYIATSISRDRDLKRDLSRDEPRSTSGGGILLLDRDKALEVGIFNEDYYVGWGDDGELYYRMKTAGYKTLYVPQAIGYHRVKKGNPRIFAQVRNRWFFILINYSLKTIILIAPALFVYEIFLFFFLLLKGEFLMYFKGNIDVLKNLRGILNKRRLVQGKRKVKDKNILTSGEMYISGKLKKNWLFNLGLALLNGFFNMYWHMIKPFL